MAEAPEMDPYSAMVAFGYESIAEHFPPMDEKVEQVRATFIALHVVSTWEQKPSLDSEEHARYGLLVS